MKVIDLLNKIANGEEVPKRIKYESHYFNYNELEKDYYEGMGYEYEYLLKNCLTTDLNDEVEIIEDTPTSKLYINNELQYDLKEDYKESYRKEIDYWRIQYSNLQDRINKAIEYIEPKMINEYLHTDYINKMLKKLRGEDNGTN